MMIGGIIKFSLVDIDLMLTVIRLKYQTLAQNIKEVVTTFVQKYISQTYSLLQHSHLLYHRYRLDIAQKIFPLLSEHLLTVLNIQLHHIEINEINIPPYYLEMINEVLLTKKLDSQD
jgi:hypothetical protein